MSSSLSSAVKDCLSLLGPGLLLEPFLGPLGFFFLVGLGLPSSSSACARLGAEDVGLLPLLSAVGVLLRMLFPRPEMFMQRSRCCARRFMTKYRGQRGHLVVGISGMVLSRSPFFFLGLGMMAKSLPWTSWPGRVIIGPLAQYSQSESGGGRDMAPVLGYMS